MISIHSFGQRGFKTKEWLFQIVVKIGLLLQEVALPFHGEGKASKAIKGECKENSLPWGDQLTMCLRKGRLGGKVKN